MKICVKSTETHLHWKISTLRKDEGNLQEWKLDNRVATEELNVSEDLVLAFLNG